MPFNFNFYSSLLLPPFFQGVIFAILLIQRYYRENRKSDIWIAGILGLLTIKIAFWMLGFAGWYDKHNTYTTFMFYFPFNNLIIAGPLFYFYFLSVTNTQFQIKKEHFKHFILPALWGLLIIVKFVVDFTYYYPFPKIEALQYGTKGYWAELDKSVIANIISYFSFFYYVYLTLQKYKAYQGYILENFSSTEKIDFVWLRNLLYAIFAVGVVAFVFFMTSTLFIKLSYTQDWVAYLILGILVYYISIYGYYTDKPYKLHFEEKTVTHTIEKTLEKTSQDTLELEAWKGKIEKYILENQSYLNSELTLSELSKALSTNTSYLSRVINEGFEQNFNDFINAHRIKEFVKRIEKGQHKTETLLSVAYDCGFNSKATFNRAFKKIYAQTPVEYIKATSIV
ncbi:MAG: AraC family transcriptional regulator [Raineya sp.]|nr:AraC family transcriptional regulator [Raineya sp.]